MISSNTDMTNITFVIEQKYSKIQYQCNKSKFENLKNHNPKLDKIMD